MIKKIISYIITLILSLLLFLFISLVVVNNTILKESYIKKVLTKKKYYEDAYLSIKNEFESYAPQLHIADTETNLDKIITKQKVTNDINQVINNIYHNKKIVIDTTVINENLTKMINTMLEDNHIDITETEKKQLEKFKKNIELAYKNNLLLYTGKYITTLSSNYQKAREIVKKTIVLLVILLIMLALVLKSLKNKSECIPITLLTVMFLSLTTRYLIIDKTQHILILSESASAIIKFIIKDIMNKIAIISTVLGILSIILTIIGNRGDTSKKKG